MIKAPIPLEYEGIYRGQLDGADKLPYHVLLPNGYEPRYPYPLLVFLHARGASESQWIDALPARARRNFAGLVLRGPQQIVHNGARVGFDWGGDRDGDAAIDEYLLPAIRLAMRTVHVHSERIFLVGLCEGASVAYRFGLTYPDRFAGVAAFNGRLPTGALRSIRRLGRQSLSLLIGHGLHNRHVSANSAEDASRLLWSAGFEVLTRYYPTGDGLHGWMLRDLDRWVVGHCESRGDST